MLGWELPPLNSGGLGVACYHMCQHLADTGVAIDFVMPYAVPDEHKVPFMNVHSLFDVIQSSETNETLSTSKQIKPYTAQPEQLEQYQVLCRKKIKQLLQQNTYDVIHCHDWLTLEAAMYAKSLSGLPLIAHVHSTEFDRCGQEYGNPIVHEIEYNCLLRADKIVAVSNATKNILVQKYGIPADNIDVVYSAADPAILYRQPDLATSYVYLQKMKQHGYKVVVSLGRLTIQKGLYYLLQAAQRAVQLQPKLLFLIVGDGEQRDELIRLSAELGIAKNVIFTGFLRGKQWRDAYEIGDMFVMSSVSEPYGLTALEAAGTGTAVLLTKQSGVSEVLRSTLQFDFWDTAKLADYIVNVAEQPKMRELLGRNARHEVRHISWRDAADQLKHLYCRMAEATV